VTSVGMASDPQRATPILSTNGRAATLVVFLVMVGYATLGRAVSRMVPVPSIEETWVPQNAVVLDSAHVRGSPRAFVFQYALGAFGCSVAMVSLRKPSHLPGFLALTGSPTHVWWTSPDTLMVQVQSDGYELSTHPGGIVVIPTHAPKPGGVGSSPNQRAKTRPPRC